MESKTEPSLQDSEKPSVIFLARDNSSCVDVGIQSFVGVDSVVVYIRPSDAEKTKHHSGARNLETRTAQRLDANELNELFLNGLRNGEEHKFKFQTQVPSYGYIFDLRYKHLIYGIVKEIDG